MAAFDPIPILKSDSPKEKAIKRRMNKKRKADYDAGHNGKGKVYDKVQHP